MAAFRGMQLASVLQSIAELSIRHGLRVANVFHAGDGNLHPLILYDANLPGELERAEAFGATFSGCAWMWAAYSPGNMASASRSAT